MSGPVSDRAVSGKKVFIDRDTPSWFPKGETMLYTIVLILAAIALIMFIMGRRRV